MIRDLRNVRPVTPSHESTPLSEEEERRVRDTLFRELGNAIADRGWTTFPAYTPEERRRLVAVGERLTAHWGRRVVVEAEDQCAMRLRLADAPAPLA
ncbi:hypothetical protein [Streptomyces millisiae]|uniref:Uncharacterized protein n=1 Tax=Streptomyces millisiae TaxID=3075542 RepID=A0ABU2LR83_9ACTN|nr:hypothetical protein [Streptomyces sp. DSM 44918]MDT0320094.1 hypothetical protein [Streptomyces sp. DSM 44918]